MKKATGLICLLWSAICLLTACDLETSDNGDLDGFWHLVQVDTIGTGGTRDLSRQRLFWACQVRLVEFSDKDGRLPSFLLHFEHGGGRLRLYDVRVFDNQTDSLLQDSTLLAPYGMNALEESYGVERLSGSRMTLNNGTLRLKFRKM